MTFKNGDRVTCIIYDTEILDARISIDQDGTPFICQNLMHGVTANDKLGYKYSWMLAKNFTQLDVTNLKLVETKSWDTLALKDILVNKYGDRRMVLDVRNDLVDVSNLNYFEAYRRTYTKKELQNLGYTIENLTEEVAEELTMEQLCKELGRTVKIKK